MAAYTTNRYDAPMAPPLIRVADAWAHGCSRRPQSPRLVAELIGRCGIVPTTYNAQPKGHGGLPASCGWVPPRPLVAH